MKRTFYFAALVLGPAVFACGPLPPPPGTGGTGGGGNPGEDAWCGAKRVLAQRCQTCHGNPTAAGAPMSLVTYDDTQKAWTGGKVWNAMKAAIESGRMPQTGGALSTEQRAAMDRWFSQGAPGSLQTCQGTDPPPVGQIGPQYLPCPPNKLKYFRAHANPTNPNDTAEYPVPANTRDKYVSFPFPSKFVTGEQAIAWAPAIDDARVIHHYILYGTQTAGSTRNGTFVAGWAPGGPNANMAPDLGLVLDFPHFYLQVHYNNIDGGAPTTDSSGIAFCTNLAMEPPQPARPNHVGIVTLGSIAISLPPGAREMPVTGTCNNLSATGKQLTIVAGSAHMHRLGTGFKTEHFNAAGQSLGIVTNVPMKTWQFDDQKPQPLQARRPYNNGERLVTTCWFNNTTNATVGFGEGTVDEMCFDFMSVYPIEDAKKLCIF
ncbi:MAG TPA: hypothetical protein VK524_22505 [Polyangiaceae bacterium]|nr:hypothetical protein [Polyangiaceae bacterium]